MITWKQTRLDLRADLARRRLLEGTGPGVFATLALLGKRGVVGVITYRFAHYCAQHRRRVLCRLLGNLEYLYTKNEISPLATLGPGLVLGDAGGIGITRVTVSGRNCTFLGCNAITLGAIEGFDVQRDRIVIGEHCVFGVGVRVMRPLSLADGTQVKPNSIVLSSIAVPGTTVSGVPARRRPGASYEQLVRWNPLRGGPIAKSA